MAREQEIIALFEGRFPALGDKLYSPRPGRIFSKGIGRKGFYDIVAFAKEEAGFFRMHHVVGTDDGAELGFLYILSDQSGAMLALRETAPKSDPRIRSLTGLFPGVLWHERELVDLYGAVVEGLPEGPNYPLPDGWPAGNYPMRKDWDPKRFNRNTMTYEEDISAQTEKAEHPGDKNE